MASQTKTPAGACAGGGLVCVQRPLWRVADGDDPNGYEDGVLELVHVHVRFGALQTIGAGGKVSSAGWRRRRARMELNLLVADPVPTC